MNNIENGCCIVTCDQPLDATYWDNQWKSESTGWDLGEPSPQLKNIIDKINNKSSKIAIPGCGNGYEAKYLADKGFIDITLIEISETAAQNLNRKFQDIPQIKVLHSDFFELEEKFDYILEQTFFCALPPQMRQKYAHKMFHSLNKNGKLTGLFFNREFESQGPPFGGTESEYRNLFKDAFTITKMRSTKLSAEPRMGSELYFELIKNENTECNLYEFDGMTCNGCRREIEMKFSKLEGVKNVSISSDFKHVLIASENEISIQILRVAIAYDPKYSIAIIHNSTLNTKK